MVDVPNSEIRWPDNFMCCGNRTFAWTYENRKVFVEFTRLKMESPTGTFKKWKDYVLNRDKAEIEPKLSV